MIVHRTPYGIAAADARDKFDCGHAWLPNPAEPMRGSILRGWRAILGHGYAAVYQDCRGRHGSEGEDRVYADDANDGNISRNEKATSVISLFMISFSSSEWHIVFWEAFRRNL